MGYIYPKSVYEFMAFDLKDLKTDRENKYSIIVDIYKNKDFDLLNDTLLSIGEKERPFTMDDVVNFK